MSDLHNLIKKIQIEAESLDSYVYYNKNNGLIQICYNDTENATIFNNANINNYLLELININLKKSSTENIAIVIISITSKTLVISLLRFGSVSTEKDTNDKMITDWMKISNLLPILVSLSITNFKRNFFIRLF